MSHGTDEARRGPAGQERVGVEGDHVADPPGHRRHASRDRRECRVARAREQAVELVELPALALPAHPLALARVPEALAVQQEETRAGGRRGAVARVETRDAVDGGGEEPIVLRPRLGGRVSPVRQEGEMEVSVRVGQEVDLQTADLFVDVRLAREQDGHHHQRPQALRHAVVKVEARERSRPEHRHHGAIDERDREVGGRDDGEGCQQDQGAETGAGHVRDEERQREEQGRHHRNRRDIARGRAGPEGAQEPSLGRNAVADRLFKERSPLGDQVVAGILGTLHRTGAGPRRGRDGSLRSGNGQPGDLELGAVGAPGEVLDRVTVLITRREVHGAEPGVGPEHVIDQADALEEVSPVER